MDLCNAAYSNTLRLQSDTTMKKLSGWTRQICFLLGRWFSDFQIIMIADGPYAVMELFAETRMYLTWTTRFRMNPSLYDFPLPYQKGQL